MKKLNINISIILCLTFSFISCQGQILPLQTALSNIPNNAYVKDLNNAYSSYLGTYKANFQDKEITLYINFVENKLEKRSTKQFYRDALIVTYIVKNSSGQILQDTHNYPTTTIEFYSTNLSSTRNAVIFNYSGTNCNVGWGDIYLKKLNSTQLSWEYRPDDIILDSNRCPAGTNVTIYLPETKGLIFSKQ